MGSPEERAGSGGVWVLLESPFFLMAVGLIVTVLSVFFGTLLVLAWVFFVAAFYRSGLFAAGRRLRGCLAILVATVTLVAIHRVLPGPSPVPAYVCASRIAPLNSRGAHGTLVEFGMMEGVTSGFLASVSGIPWTDVNLDRQFGAWWASPLRTDLPANHQPVTGSGLLEIGDGSVTRALPPPANISPARSLYFYIETDEPFTNPSYRFIQNYELRDEPNADAIAGQFGPCPRNRE